MLFVDKNNINILERMNTEWIPNAKHLLQNMHHNI